MPRVRKRSGSVAAQLLTLTVLVAACGSAGDQLLDTTPPDIVRGAAAYTGLAVDADVQVTFSEAVESSTVNSLTFTLVRAGLLTPVPATVTYQTSARQATLDPSNDLEPTAVYRAKVTSGVTDADGNPMPGDREWWILTAGGPPVRSGPIQREATTTVINPMPTGTVTVAAPEGTTSGDVLVACLSLNTRRVAPDGIPADWLPFATVTPIPNPHVLGYFKVAGDSEPDYYTWTLTAPAENSGGIARYSGVDTASPLDAVVTEGSGVATRAGTIPSVTTSTAGAMIVSCMGANSSTDAVNFASPAGLVEAWDLGGKRHELADGVQAVAGPSGTKTWTFRARREWAGWLTALRPS